MKAATQRIAIARVSLATVCGVLVWRTVSSGSDGGLTEIVLSEGPEPEVRFVSGTTIYGEALAGGRWVGRCWKADGRMESPVWHSVEPAFQTVGSSLPSP